MESGQLPSSLWPTVFCEAYLKLLKENYGGLNLTKLYAPEEFYEKQYYDSLAPFLEVPPLAQLMKRAPKVFDLGPGGGFPLLPLAWHFRDKSFVGIEARAKKVRAVSEMALSMGMTNVQVRHGRFEREPFPDHALLSVRAVGKIQDILKALPKKGKIDLLFYKGPRVRELETVPHQYHGWNLAGEYTLELFSKYQRTYFHYC